MSAASSKVSPTLADFLPLAKKLACRISKNPSDVDDLAQVGMISLYEALKKTPRPRKPWAFARTVLHRHMAQEAMKKFQEDKMLASLEGLGEADRDRPNPEPVSRSSLLFPREAGNPQERLLHDELFLDSYLRQIEIKLGTRARWTAQNLIEPGRMHGRALVATALEKQARHEANPEHGLRGRTKIRPSHRQLRRTLRASKSEWRQLLADIRAFTLGWLEAQDLGNERVATR